MSIVKSDTLISIIPLPYYLSTSEDTSDCSIDKSNSIEDTSDSIFEMLSCSEDTSDSIEDTSDIIFEERDTDLIEKRVIEAINKKVIYLFCCFCSQHLKAVESF